MTSNDQKKDCFSDDESLPVKFKKRDKKKDTKNEIR